MDSLVDILNTSVVEKKAKFRWQDQCNEISKSTGLSFGLMTKVWVKGGYPVLDIITSQLKQGELTNPQAYILSLLKN